MFYTFGDYRDLCLGTDISAKTENGDITKAKNTIDRIFKHTGGTEEHKRKNWWEKNKNDIWQGMLCALEKVAGKTGTLTTKYPYHTIKFSGGDSNSPTLEKFAQTPQFLRWFTEWGDQFCREREKQLATLLKECPEKICNEADENKQKCTAA
ncbi:pfEMP1, partial [Plasmodium falciparum HB3]